MVRRAKPATQRQIKSYRKSAAKSDLQELAKETRRITARAVQNAAIEISNGLVKAGPIWSGRFASSWYLEGVGNIGGPRVSDSIYKYSAKDFRVTSVEKALSSGVSRFQLVNTAPHAGIALDQELGIYRHPGDEDPLKDPVEFGFRPTDENGKQKPSLRWDISTGYDYGSKVSSMITAEADWLGTYALGGALNRDLGRGVTLGLKT